MATTINIHGSSNDTNLVLGSNSASIADSGSVPASVVPNIADSVLAGRMFSYPGDNLLFYFLSATQMVRLRIHPDISYSASDLTNKNWWLNDVNVITDFVYEFDSAVYDASQNVHLQGSLVSLTPVSSESVVFSAFQWKNAIISSSSLRVPAGDMVLGPTTPSYDVVLQEVTNVVALPNIIQGDIDVSLSQTGSELGYLFSVQTVATTIETVSGEYIYLPVINDISSSGIFLPDDTKIANLSSLTPISDFFWDNRTDATKSTSIIALYEDVDVSGAFMVGYGSSGNFNNTGQFFMDFYPDKNCSDRLKQFANTTRNAFLVAEFSENIKSTFYSIVPGESRSLVKERFGNNFLRNRLN